MELDKLELEQLVFLYLKLVEASWSSLHKKEINLDFLNNTRELCIAVEDDCIVLPCWNVSIGFIC